jgi:ubiquitin C-terminal hydrolase
LAKAMAELGTKSRPISLPRYCPQCKTHQRAFKKLDLWSLPQILIIHLKRFLYSRYTRDKIETEIEIPVRGMELGDKVLDPSHKQEKYDLIGISNHSGDKCPIQH